MTDRWTPYKIEQLEAHLTARDSEILQSLEQFRALSTRLIQRLHFPVGEHGLHRTERTATRLCNRVLLRLEADGFIARIEGRAVGGATRGSAGTTWHLAATGERLLRARRGDPSRRRYVTPSRSFLAHTLAVAGFAATAREHEAAGTFDILELHPEPMCWRTFQTALGQATLKPDLAIVIANPDVEAHVFVEIDRGTEHLPAVIKKSRAYQQYRQTGIEQHRSGVFPAVLWVVPDADRARRLRNAIRREQDLDADLFTITETSSAMTALAGFLTPSTPTRKEVSP
ncbi:replication-relaxation family protein [Microbacterium candidum]|uniref:Replication-relaxation family protein n=1 Tax=Microbacterium candidum TaxID=3041922 RepID=A0ABT7N0B6_9MICO|nr:replication-relaxation family protein [Microbacterium sp. ASV49]MDL9980101.1 replication-relaxation family protein [Microbacterium sp. ASV49]